MANQSTEVDFFVVPAQVWSSLATDLKTRTIWLFSQLAFNIVTAQAERTHKEAPDATIAYDYSQDSA